MHKGEKIDERACTIWVFMDKRVAEEVAGARSQV